VGEPEAVIRGVLAAEAARRGATPIRIVAEEGSAEGIRVDASGTSFRWTREGRAVPVTVGIPGRHQANNAMVALTMNECLPGDLRVPEPEAIAALASVSLPGRFSRRGDWLFDVAHNAQGAAVTAETLRAVSPEGPVVALVSILGDKDWRGMLQALAPAVSHLVLTDTPTAPASRAWRAEEVLAFAQGEGWSAELVRDFDAALAAADARGRTVLVTGSFHTVGDAMARLGIAPHAP
jgi:dihydrofolate synthase / folylpolyglutamate synthase